jgi:hypothetical protein
MNRPIQAGDVVVVVKPAKCGSQDNLGHVFRVLSVVREEVVICTVCLQDHGPATMAVERVDYAEHKSFGVEVWRLKRLDADPEKTDTRNTEELAV